MIHLTPSTGESPLHALSNTAIVTKSFSFDPFPRFCIWFSHSFSNGSSCKCLPRTVRMIFRSCVCCENALWEMHLICNQWWIQDSSKEGALMWLLVETTVQERGSGGRPQEKFKSLHQNTFVLDAFESLGGFWRAGGRYVPPCPPWIRHWPAYLTQ